MVDQLSQRKWKETLRPITAFAMPNQFSRPRTAKETTSRLEMNLSYFLTNYLVLSLIIFSIAIISRPGLLIVAVCLTMLWTYALNSPELRIGQIVLRGKNKMFVLVMLTAALVFVTAGSTIFMVVGLCSTVVMLHAIFHRSGPALASAAVHNEGVEMTSDSV
eukprot:TRINITY_DN66376_c13_g9_i1.p2 TRINITY_DN66376_c13_g9~~TRINITY_DN66376_c13_g9_i1.p2  ORF type:complete len:162 (-),score=77.32 TRINITY_DN66376_c13_g9_i1:242-727(-)